MFASLASLVLLSFVCIASGALISSSKLELCRNDGSEEIPCEKKFVVAVTLDGGQNNTESIVFWRGTGDPAKPKPGDATLDVPYRISIAKSEPLVRYPVTYAQNFNAKPRESVIYTGVLGCEDSPTSAEPTCGRAYTSTGSAIPFSEGFCCKCSACQIVGFCDANSRANTDCSLFGDAASASCLTFDDLWYSGYTIGSAETWYRITVSISGGGSASTTELSLGPDVLIASDQSSGVASRLVGDFAAFKDNANLEDQFLFIPASPASHPVVQMKGPAEWMLIDDYRVSTTGADCNKIGVSYEAFAQQGSRCKGAVGSCLAGQLSDFRASDASRQEKGLTPQHLISGRGDFFIVDGDSGGVKVPGSAARRMMHPAKATRPYLSFVKGGVQASLLTLTFAADKLSYVINVASGRLVAVNISDFEANSEEGRLAVAFLNTGTVQADFYVTVRGCTEGTFPIASDVVTVLPLRVATMEFQVRSEKLQGQSNRCNVSLLDAEGTLLDSRAAEWNSTDTIEDRGAQGGSGNGASGVPVRPPPPRDDSSGQSCTDCPFYNPLCFITRECFVAVVIQIIVTGLILAAIVMAIKHHRKCCPKSEETKKERTSRRKKGRRYRHTVVAIPPTAVAPAAVEHTTQPFHESWHPTGPPQMTYAKGPYGT